MKILFVCLGNICRSPMAEFMFKKMIDEKGLKNVECASAATSDEELGNPVYPPARAKLAEMGISCKGKYARQMDKSDYNRYDLLLGMESRNIAAMKRICGGDSEGKIMRLMDFTENPRDIADPWYTGNFDITASDISEGLAALAKVIQRGN